MYVESDRGLSPRWCRGHCYGRPIVHCTKHDKMRLSETTDLQQYVQHQALTVDTSLLGLLPRFVKGSTHPSLIKHTPSFLDLADKLGMCRFR